MNEGTVLRLERDAGGQWSNGKASSKQVRPPLPLPLAAHTPANVWSRFACVDGLGRRVVERAADRTRVELTPVSGRSHQLVREKHMNGVPCFLFSVGGVWWR